jgi:hypothetical protein
MTKYYTESYLKENIGNQIHSKNNSRSLTALNSLVDMFGYDWVETELDVYTHTDSAFMEVIGTSKYKGITTLEKVVFAWEDINLIKNLSGFSELKAKIQKGLRNQNVDLELSISADLIRSNSILELEPNVGGSRSDSRFKITSDSPWIYVEISRRDNHQTKIDISTKGKELAKIVSLLKPGKKCIIFILKEINEGQYQKIIEWLKSNPNEGVLDDIAEFITIDSNVDPTIMAWKKIEGSCSFRMHLDYKENLDGTAYFHFIDDGSKSKMNEKRYQLPQNELGILFLDLTNVDGGFTDYKKLVEFRKPVNHFSSMVIFKDGNSSQGFRREVEIINNPKSKNRMPKEGLDFLRVFSEIRLNKSLIE